MQKLVWILAMLAGIGFATQAGAITLYVKRIVTNSDFGSTPTLIGNDTPFSATSSGTLILAQTSSALGALNQLNDSVAYTCDVDAAKQPIGDQIVWTVFAVNSCK